MLFPADSSDNLIIVAHSWSALRDRKTVLLTPILSLSLINADWYFLTPQLYPVVTLAPQHMAELSSVMASPSAAQWLTRAGKASKHQAWPPDTAQPMGRGQDNPQIALVGWSLLSEWLVQTAWDSHAA